MGNCSSSKCAPAPKAINLCYERKWEEIKVFLFSNATEKKKIESLMYKHNDVWTCLHEACSYRAPLQVIEAMIKVGGRELLRGGTSTALHNACTRRFAAPAEIVELLIDAGGKDLVMQKDHNGRTALHGACRCGASIEIVEFLVAAGGRDLVLQKDNHGRTALHASCRYGATSEIVEILIATGGKELVMQSTNHGETALHEVRFHKKDSYSETLDIVRALLTVGGRDLAMQKHKYGRTALQRVSIYVTRLTPPRETSEALEMLKWMMKREVLRKEDIQENNLLVESCCASDSHGEERFRFLVEWNPQALKVSDHRSILHDLLGHRLIDRNEALSRFKIALRATMKYYADELGFLFQKYNPADKTTVVEKAYTEFGKEATWKIVEDCLEENSIMIHERNSRNNVYPFMIGAVSDSSDVSIVYYLLRKSPFALGDMN